MFEVQALLDFTDLEKKIDRREKDIFTVDTVKRLRELLGNNKRGIKSVKLLSCKKRGNQTYNGPKIIIYQNFLYYIGGIETFLNNLVKNYRDRNITIVINNLFENEEAIALSQYCDVIIDEDSSNYYKCDVLILDNYNGDDIINRVSTKKIYQMIHADWSELKKMGIWSNYNWIKNNSIDEIISVSDTAKNGLKTSMGYDSKVIYNILDCDIEKENDMKVFITLSRATQEKGIERILKMAEAFRDAGKHFVWFLGCPLEQARPDIAKRIKDIPEFIIIKPSADNQSLISHCDYLVQLSDAESFCYSAYEALQRNVPVILTDFNEAKNIVDDGENGYILKKDLSNLDVDKIFSKVPKNLYYIDRCNKDSWEKVFKGEF